MKFFWRFMKPNPDNIVNSLRRYLRARGLTDYEVVDGSTFYTRLFNYFSNIEIKKQEISKKLPIPVTKTIYRYNTARTEEKRLDEVMDEIISELNGKRLIPAGPA